MEIRIKRPLFIHGLGQRKNQEDSIFPDPIKVSLKEKIFIVCDGVGGIDKGEVASDLASREFYKHLSSLMQGVSLVTPEIIISAFEQTQNSFDKYIEKEPNSKGMATTLVSLVIDDNGITSVHCGDSRFYHIRNDKIIWLSEDHTVINELIKAGVMTEEEAKDSKRNKISRAIQGNSVRKTKPDIHKITDVQAGDYFLICSDGISGSITDEELCDTLSSEGSNEAKIDTINTLCEANSADNFTAFLLQIEDIKTDAKKIDTNDEKEPSDTKKIDANDEKEPSENDEELGIRNNNSSFFQKVKGLFKF